MSDTAGAIIASMSSSGFAVFDTAVGPCGIAWDDRRVIGVQLPEASLEKMHARLSRRFPALHEAAPPADIQQVIERIIILLQGERIDLTDVLVDMERVPAFNRQVYEIARSIPPGSTLTYGDVAKRLGDPAIAREVGQALGQNPFPIIVPCHRVIAAGGKTGGFSGGDGVKTKLKLLMIELAKTDDLPSLFD